MVVLILSYQLNGDSLVGQGSIYSKSNGNKIFITNINKNVVQDIKHITIYIMEIYIIKYPLNQIAIYGKYTLLLLKNNIQILYTYKEYPEQTQ